MTTLELNEILSCGETSKVQFKMKMPHAVSLAKEKLTMSNSIGGIIIIGVEDVTGKPIGLSSIELEKYDKIISSIAYKLKPTVYATIEIVKSFDNKSVNNHILIIHIDEGINKPYKTQKGEIYVKQGSNKRLLTDNGEMMRLLQNSGNLLADELEVYGTSSEDIDSKNFEAYFQKKFSASIEDKGLSYIKALRAKRVLRNEQLTLARLLFFGKEPQSTKPAFTIKAVSFFGNDIGGSHFRSKPNDLKGTIPQILIKAMGFLMSILHFVQSQENFNSKGQLVVSKIALEELLINALVHRAYFKTLPIRLLIFDDRIEIMSPGKLPKSLTVEDIKYGNPVIRNNHMVYFSTHTLPYSGLGSGIRRATAAQPNITFINDIQGEQFTAIMPRPSIR